MGNVLKFSAIVEAGTGLALALAPALVATLLLGADLNAVAVVIARCFECHAVALALASWSSRRSGPDPAVATARHVYIQCHPGRIPGVHRGHRGIRRRAPRPAVALHGAVALLLMPGLARAGTATRS